MPVTYVRRDLPDVTSDWTASVSLDRVDPVKVQSVTLALSGTSSAGFSTANYLASYADVKAAGINPLLHYVTAGQAEGRLALPA